MIKTITKFGVALLLAMGMIEAQAQMSFATKADYQTGNFPFNVATGDLNGDGKPDIVVANNSTNTISVLTNTGNGSFGSKTDYVTDNSPTGIAIGDINGDGLPDLAVTNNATNTVSILTNAGGNFTLIANYTTSSSPYHPVLADFNADGKLDLAVICESDSRFNVWTQFVDGGFDDRSDYTTPSGPRYLAVGDLNSDGKLDIVTANSGSSSVSVFTHTGTNFYGSRLDYSTGSIPQSVTIGDLNGDGLPDLVTPNYSSNSISVLYNNGNGFNPKIDYSTGNGTNPVSVGIGDFNGDEKPDLAVACTSSDLIRIFTNTGTSFGLSLNYNTGYGPRSIAIADFNGDEKPDIVTANMLGGNANVFLNTSFFAKPFITEWDLAIGGSGATQLTFSVSTTGVVNYKWQTIPSSTVSGVGTFTGTVASITGLPTNAKVRLSIAPSNFVRFFINNSADRVRLMNIAQWGTASWTSMASAFRGCNNMQMTATDAPVLTGVTDMSYMFFQASSFNHPIGNWDVSNVTNMEYMFCFIGSFNQSLSGWNVSNVTNMNSMFLGATAFNQPLGGWDVRKVTNMNSMFQGAAVFNQPIGSWITTSVTSMNAMFQNAYKFNQPIANWNVSNVANMGSMFLNATDFNQPIGNWNVSNVENMSSMFQDAEKFNQPLGGWDVSKVTNMEYMFYQTVSFNQSLSGWNVSNVTNMNNMFYYTQAFNQPLGAWNVSKVEDMSSMFEESLVFNQSLGAWGTKLNPSVDLTGLLSFSKSLSVANYDATLQGFAAGSVTGRNLGAVELIYCNKAARDVLTASGRNWSIVDAGGVTPTIPGILTQPFNQSSCAGLNITFSVSTDGSNFTYAWSNGLSTTETMQTSIPGVYNVTVSSGCGRAISNTVSLNTLAGTSISAQTSSQTVCGGNVVNFGISPTGHNLSFLWNNGSNTNFINTSVPGTYIATISGTCGSVVSNEVSLTTLAGTAIVTQPLSQIIQPSATADLSVSATGANLMYLWSSNETVSAITGKQSGIYTVTVSGTCGSVVSNAATIVGLLLSNATVTGAVSNGALTSATSITISGTGFANALTITVNGVALSNFTVVSGTMIIATMPANTLLASNNVILVQNPNQVASASTPVAVVDVTLSTNLPTYQSTSFSIYPNPVTNGAWKIENGELGAIMYVFNAQGAIVYTQTITSLSTEVNSKLTSGIYLVKVGNQTTKLVIE